MVYVEKGTEKDNMVGEKGVLDGGKEDERNECDMD